MGHMASKIADESQSAVRKRVHMSSQMSQTSSPLRRSSDGGSTCNVTSTGHPRIKASFGPFSTSRCQNRLHAS
eukprot:6179171-Pleurochrysis_carterae.AAC.1